MWILYLPKFIIWYVQYFSEQVTFSTFKNSLFKHYSQKYGIYKKSVIQQRPPGSFLLHSIRSTRQQLDLIISFALILVFFLQICFLNIVNSLGLFKVLSLLEACFGLISGSSLSMKIQIMGGKMAKNLEFKSPLRKVKKFCSFFVSFSNSPQKTAYLCF